MIRIKFFVLHDNQGVADLIEPSALPPAFPRMAVDTRFYHLALV